MIVSRLPVFEHCIGIDHAFSFPLRCFETHHLPPDWPNFLDDFQKHWPTAEDNTYVNSVRGGLCGGAVRQSALAAAGRRARRGQVGVSLRCSGPGRQVHPRRPAVAAVHAAADRRSGPFLAVRRLGSPGRSFGHFSIANGEGISAAIYPPLCGPYGPDPGGCCGRRKGMAKSCQETNAGHSLRVSA